MDNKTQQQQTGIPANQFPGQNQNVNYQPPFNNQQKGNFMSSQQFQPGTSYNNTSMGNQMNGQFQQQFIGAYNMNGPSSQQQSFENNGIYMQQAGQNNSGGVNIPGMGGTNSMNRNIGINNQNAPTYSGQQYFGNNGMYIQQSQNQTGVMNFSGNGGMIHMNGNGNVGGNNMNVLNSRQQPFGNYGMQIQQGGQNINIPGIVGMNNNNGNNGAQNMNAPNSGQQFFQNNGMNNMNGIPGNVGMNNMNGNPVAGLSNQAWNFQIQIYSNKKWYISEQNRKKTDFVKQRLDFFNNSIKNEQIQNSIMFILNGQQKIWIDRRCFHNTNEVLLDVYNEQEVDLTPVFRVTNRFEDLYNALFYCSFGYIELNEEKEMSYFLLACILLKVKSPFQKLENYLQEQQQQQNVDEHKLQDYEEILDLLLFFDQSSEYSDQFCEGTEDFCANTLMTYKEMLITQNSCFYLTKDYIPNPKIQNFSVEYFTVHILSFVLGQLIPEDQQYVSMAQVETFHKFIEHYYCSSQSVDPKQQIEILFGSLYEQRIKQKLKQEDQIECLKYFPQDQTQLLQQLKQQYIQNQQHQMRERAFVRILIAQRAQNIALESYKDQFKQSYEIITTQNLPQDIEDLVKQEINIMIQQQQQQ